MNFNNKKTYILFSILLGLLPWQKVEALTITLNSNGGFETGDFTDWIISDGDNSGGDVKVQMGTTGLTGGTNSGDDFGQIGPNQGSYHAVITTGCNTPSESNSGFCEVDGRPGSDDGSTAAGTFNYSTKDVANATTLVDGTINYELQNFLGVSDNAFNNIAGDPGANRRGDKEGSAIKQQFTITAEQAALSPKLTFSWAFLSNDTLDRFSEYGRDFAFFTVYNNSSAESSRTINILKSSDEEDYDFYDNPATPNDIERTMGAVTEFQAQINLYNLYTFSTQPITVAGTYTFAIGVLDGDGSELTSAVLVDNVTLKAEVPESSNLLGILGLGLGLLFMPKSRIKK